MTKKSIIRCILSVAIVSYLVAAFFFIEDMSASERVGKVRINIHKTQSKGKDFVTAEGMRSELGDIPYDSISLSSFDTHQIENKLNSNVNIENAEVTASINGNINIDIVPMIPVARIFNTKHESYYINRDGKKLTADSRYHIDVPIITGHIDDDKLKAVDVLPLINFVSSNSTWNALASSFKVTSNHDVLLIPSIRGHVVNLGNPLDNNTADKFDRLMTFYKKVMPLKGWQYYDTISVKFSGQVVATKAKKRTPTQSLLHELTDTEEESLDNMLTH